MKNMIMAKPGQKSKILFIKKQLTKNNSNWLELFQGPSGSGKTWAAISQCQAIDPDFDVNSQIVFNFRQFMKLINNEEFLKRKWRLVIFDEPQTDISNRNWQSLTNKLMNYLMTTFRHKNIAVLFCCPYKDFLDSASMKMIHCITEMVSIDQKKGLSKTKPRLQQYNADMKKYYTPRIQVITHPHHKIVPLTFDYIQKPTKGAIEVYEAAKTRFTTQLNKEIEIKLDQIAAEDQVVPLDKRMQLTDTQKKVMITIANSPTQTEAAKKLGIACGTLSRHKQAAEKRGWNVEEFKNE